MNKEIDYLKEHLYEIYKYKKSMKDLTYDMDLEHLLRTCKALDYSQQEINRLNNIIDEKDYKIKRIVYSCYESDMSYDEFKRIWVNVFGKLYDPKDIDKLENELKGDNK